MTKYPKTWFALAVCLCLGIAVIAQSSPPRRTGDPRGGIVSSGPPGMSTSGGTFSGPVCFEDNVELQLGTACDPAVDGGLYWDGTNAYFVTGSGDIFLNPTGNLMIASGGGSPPAADTDVHIWSGTAGTVSCNSGLDVLCLENNNSAYLRSLAVVGGLVGFVAGDASNASYAGMYFGMSAHPTSAGEIVFQTAAQTNILAMGVGQMEHPQATTYSTLAGDLTLSPAGNLELTPSSGQITVTGADIVLTSINRPRILDESASLINPVFTSNDLNTGLGFDGTNDTPALIGGGVTMLACPNSTVDSCYLGTSVFLDHGTAAGITASTTQSQGQQPLTSTINEVSVVANSSDTVTLPAASAGRFVEVYNNGANLLQVFPASGDDLGGGVDQSGHVAAGGIAEFRAYDATTWIEKHNAPSAEMYDGQNTDAYVIHSTNERHCYHTNGMTVDAASLSGGWTFDAGGAGTSHAITAVADAGGGDITVTTGTSHLLAVDDIISQTALTDAAYVGVFKVLTVPTGTTYTVTAVYTATDTGFMDQCAYMVSPSSGAAGRYIATADITATNAVNNETFDFVGYVDTTAYLKAEIRRKFAIAGDWGSLSGGAFGIVGNDQKITLTVQNITGTGDLTLRNINFRLVKIR